MSTPLSPEGYAAAGGNVCPVCGDPEIAMEIDYDCCSYTTMTQNAQCCNCLAAWDVVYELTGYTGLTLHEKEEDNE